MEFDLPSLPISAHLLLAVTPVLDATYVIQVSSRALHILSAIILLGGLFYMRTVLAPAGSDACFAGRRAIWARWAGIASGLLLLTGIYNFLTINNQVKAEGDSLERAYHMLFGVKFLLALLLMFLAAVLAGKTDLAERFRSQMGKWLNVSWVVGLAIVIVAALLRTFH